MYRIIQAEIQVEKTGEEIQSILKTLPKLKPFDTLDVESEKKRISELFTKEKAFFIMDYFSRKGAISHMDRGAAVLGVLPQKESIDKTQKAPKNQRFR